MFYRLSEKSLSMTPSGSAATISSAPAAMMYDFDVLRHDL